MIRRMAGFEELGRESGFGDRSGFSWGGDFVLREVVAGLLPIEINSAPPRKNPGLKPQAWKISIRRAKALL
jgi:hypothetical protein